MRRILFFLFLIFQIFTYGQSQKIKLTEAIKIAQQKSPDYVRALNTHQASYWRYRNYVADLLPQLSLRATLPEYSNSIRRIINDEGQEIALKRYEITKKRYVLGKITITDLNIAQEEKDKAVVDYLNSLEKFWLDYYTLRRVTLYDFKADEKITIEDILFD